MALHRGASREPASGERSSNAVLTEANPALCAAARAAEAPAGRRSGTGRRRLPADPRRAAARRQRPAQPRDVRDDLDGAAGAPADGRVRRQEHDRQGRVSRSTAELERRCVAMLAELWHAPLAEAATGCSTTGSSEACMLAGLALKRRFRPARRQRRAAAQPRDGRERPGLLGEVLPVLGGRAARRTDLRRALPPRCARGGGALRREHDRRRRDPRLDVRRQLRAGGGDRGGARRARRGAAARTSRSTSTARRAA